MLDHPTIATAISGIIGLGVGGGAGFVIAAKALAIRARDEHLSDLTGEMVDLSDDAALGRKVRRQREIALSRAREANAAKAAVKQESVKASAKVAAMRECITRPASPARITAPKKPTRKSAIAS